jgi:hypothetical protein
MQIWLNIEFIQIKVSDIKKLTDRVSFLMRLSIDKWFLVA